MKKNFKLKYVILAILILLVLAVYLLVVNILLTINVFKSVQEIKMDRKMYQQVVDSYDSYVKIFPFDYKAYDARGEANYRKRGDYEKSKDDFATALRLNPNDVSIYEKLASTYLRLGDFDNAYYYCDKAVLKFPDNASAYNCRAWVGYMNGENLDKALQDVNVSLSFSEAPYSLHTRAAIYNKQGRYYDAIADLNKAIEMDPRASYAYYEKGCSQIKLHYKKAGLKNIKKAFTIEQKDKKSTWTEEESKKMLKKYKQPIEYPI